MRGLWLRAPGRWNPEIARTTPPNPPLQIPAPAEPHRPPRAGPEVGSRGPGGSLWIQPLEARPSPGPRGQECANGAGWALLAPGGTCGL